MTFNFSKYQGTGNDFIMIDGRQKTVKFSADEIMKICHRRFGVGADGLIILKDHSDYDFEMDYYNADGSQSFCGNGSRCAQAYAKELNIIADTSNFLAIDGAHEGKNIGSDFATKMTDVSNSKLIQADYFINTGSPHYIRYVDDVSQIDVHTEGCMIRNSKPYQLEGTNVNFVSQNGEKLDVRTYERGVEAETFSCGTGVTAVAISYLIQQNSYQKSVNILTKGGDLRVDINRISDNEFEEIWLIGPAEKVYEGEYSL